MIVALCTVSLAGEHHVSQTGHRHQATVLERDGIGLLLLRPELLPPVEVIERH